jgi:hypothetical protein
VRQWTEPDVWKGYQKPALNKLTFRQATQALLGRARDLLPFFSPEQWHPGARQTVPEQVPKEYQTPRLSKRTAEQARLILIGHATVGDPGAKGLMELIFSEKRPELGES